MTRLPSKCSTILTRAQKLIERGWCQNHHAQTKNGEICHFNNKRAVKWCAAGAVNSFSRGDRYKKTIDFLDRSVSTLCIVKFNDAKGRKKGAVIQAFDRAIALALKEHC